MEDKGEIAFHSADINYVCEEEETIANWIETIIMLEEEELQRINVIWCSDEYLIKINKEHLNHDYYTDIITFHYEEDVIDGELYISIDRVKENAAVLKIPFKQELLRVVSHGILHLCGYGDKTKEEIKIMRSKEEACLMFYEG